MYAFSWNNDAIVKVSEGLINDFNVFQSSCKDRFDVFNLLASELIVFLFSFAKITCYFVPQLFKLIEQSAGFLF